MSLSAENLLELNKILRGLAFAFDALCAANYTDAADNGINGIAWALLDATDRPDDAMIARGTIALDADERMHDLAWCAEETGLALDMLESFTRPLDPVLQRAVLAEARKFAERFEVTTKIRSPAGGKA